MIHYQFKSFSPLFSTCMYDTGILMHEMTKICNFLTQLHVVAFFCLYSSLIERGVGDQSVARSRLTSHCVVS